MVEIDLTDITLTPIAPLSDIAFIKIDAKRRSA